MSNTPEPIVGEVAGDAAAATTLSPDAPRLPDAVPGETANPAPVEPAPLADESFAEPETPSTPKQSGTPAGFVVVMLLIVGAIVAIGAVARPWESTPEEPATTTVGTVDEPGVTTAGTAGATTAATPPATTVPVADEAEPATTTTIVVGALPQPAVTDAVGAAQTDASAELTELCQRERTTLSDAVGAFFDRRDVPPSDPDALVADGLIGEHPEGWSSRWRIDTGASGTAVVPVDGTECDL